MTQCASFGKAKMFPPPATHALRQAANKNGQERCRLIEQFKCQTTMTATGMKNLHGKAYHKSQRIGKHFCKGAMTVIKPLRLTLVFESWHGN
jgi:hypothetical protein